MTGKLRGARGSVFRNQGTIDAQLWKSLQGALFLEPTHSLSRVEAYPADLLVPAREVVTSAAQGPNPGITETDPAVVSPTTAAPDDHDVDDDEFEMTQFVALRTPEDITDYV